MEITHPTYPTYSRISSIFKLELEMLKHENTMLRKFFADNNIPLPEGVSK